MSVVEPAPTATSPKPVGPTPHRQRFAYRLLQRRGGLIGMVIIAGLILLALLAPVIAPHAPGAQDIARRLEGPSWTHLLGTDQLGRDTLSRAIYGTQVALRVAIPSVVLALVVGMVLGLLGGYVGGIVDSVVVVVLDSLQSFPAVILALTLLAVIGPSLASVTIVIAIAFVPNYGRVTRAQVLVTKYQPWVDAERCIGVRSPRLLARHITPNIVTPLWVIMAMDIPSAIGIEAGLSFLGLGVQVGS